MQHSPHHPALARAIAAAVPPIPPIAFAAPPAQPRATPRNTAQQNTPPAQNEPTPNHGQCTIDHARKARPRPLKPIQRTAARLLLLGHPVSIVAQTLRIHPYTVSRWKRNPRFQAELDRQLALHLTLDHDDQPLPPAQPGATPRNTAQQFHPPAQNEANAHAFPHNGQRTTDHGTTPHPFTHPPPRIHSPPFATENPPFRPITDRNSPT